MSDTVSLRELDEKKVNKEIGKGLSKNDFTDEYKGKLDNLSDAVRKGTDEQLGLVKGGGDITINPDGTMKVNALHGITIVDDIL